MTGDTQTVAALVLAFILGWLADWALEIYHWRRSRQQRERARVQAQLDSKDARLKELEAQLESLRASGTPKAHGPMQMEADLKAARGELADAGGRQTEQTQELTSLRRLLEDREEEISRLHQQLGVPDEALAMPDMPEGPVMTIESESMADSLSESPVSVPSEEETSLDEAARRTAAWLSDTPESTAGESEATEVQTDGEAGESTESDAGKDNDAQQKG